MYCRHRPGRARPTTRLWPSRRRHPAARQAAHRQACHLQAPDPRNRHHPHSLVALPQGLCTVPGQAPDDLQRGVRPTRRPLRPLRAPSAPRYSATARFRWQERSAGPPSGAGCEGSNPSGGTLERHSMFSRSPAITLRICDASQLTSCDICGHQRQGMTPSASPARPRDGKVSVSTSKQM